MTDASADEIEFSVPNPRGIDKTKALHVRREDAGVSFAAFGDVSEFACLVLPWESVRSLRDRLTLWLEQSAK